MGDLLIVFPGELVERQKLLLSVEAEVAAVIVGEVPGIAAVADDEQLQEAQQGFGIAVAGVVFVIDDLLHGAAWANGQGFQLDLYDWHTVDQQEHIIAVVAAVGVDAELVDHLKGVFAPVLDIDQGVEQRRAVVSLKAVALAQVPRGRKDIERDDLIQQSSKLGIHEIHPVERLKLFAEVLLQRGAISDVRSITVFEIAQFFDQGLFNCCFSHCHAQGIQKGGLLAISPSTKTYIAPAGPSLTRFLQLANKLTACFAGKIFAFYL